MNNTRIQCQDVVAQGLDERYVAGALEGADREAFEEHYFGCAGCFDRVALLHVARGHLIDDAPRPGTNARRPAPSWAAPLGWTAAAGLAAGLAAAAWWPSAPAVAPEVASRRVSSIAAPPESPRGELLDALAPFDPPQYRQTTLRGAGDDTGRIFTSAMDLYARGQFAEAIPGLERIADRRVDATFFLAACHLLTADVAAAITRARQAVAFGDTPYREEATLLLAKALVRQHNVAEARAHLESVVRMDGDHRTEAARLLTRLPIAP